MKKFFTLGFVMICVFMLSGCTKVIPLTEDENYLIAEYAAELLLKYDRNMDMKYDSSTTAEPTTEEISEETTEAITTESTSTEDATASTEAVTTEDIVASTEETTTESSGGPVGTITEVSGVTADVDSDFDIAGFAGLDDVSIEYAYYMVLERYPSYDHEGMYIEITAPSGYKLLVVKFDVESKINDSQYVDMYSKDLSYEIILNNNRSAKQMLTILIDDLYTYQMQLDGSERQEAVLLFQISDSLASKIQDLKLKVTDGTTSHVIQLQ